MLDLVKIDDESESNLIGNDILPGQVNVWIGLNDLETKNLWKWIDGSIPTYTNWAAGQPDDQGEQRRLCPCFSVGYASLARAWARQRCCLTQGAKAVAPARHGPSIHE